MKAILTSDLKPGMITAQRVFTPGGQFLLEAGSTLTAQMIAHITYYSIPSVPVTNGSYAADGLHDFLKNQYVPVESRALKIQQSKEYRVFSKKFHKNVSTFHSALNDFIIRDRELDTELLLNETLELFEAHTTTISMFDMLHNLRQIDDSTYAHSVNVAIIARMIGIWLGFSDTDLNLLTLSGLLHDIGKSQISNRIIAKPDKLTPEEYAKIQQHPILGYEILKKLSLDFHVKNAALMHHERCDGKGYPFGLKEGEIDDFASIISIADVYDAMTADRCYRSGLCPFEVIAQFEQDGLQKYNPKYILTFLDRIANTYMHNNILLSNGITGEIILINKRLTRPVIRVGPQEFINLEERLDLYIQAII